MVSEKILYLICDISAHYASIAGANIPHILEPPVRNIKQSNIWQIGGYESILYLSLNGLVRVCVLCIWLLQLKRTSIEIQLQL